MSVHNYMFLAVCHFYVHKVTVDKTDRHPFNSLFFRTAWVSWHQKG